MMKSKLLLITAVGIFLLFSRISLAQVPQMINYQGFLTNPSTGQPVADGSYEVVFKIYNEATNGTALWTETRNLETENGIYNIILGSLTPISAAILDGSERYLGIKVNGDPEMTPRARIVSVAYAILSKTTKSADWNSLTNIPAGFADGVDNEGTGGDNIPSGGIIMWSGTISNIPTGWALCDGTNGTPDLRSRFVMGVPDASTNPGAIGGSLVHKHDLPFINYPSSGETRLIMSSFSGHTITTNQGLVATSTGTQRTGPAMVSFEAESLPPYYALAFIMKL